MISTFRTERIETESWNDVSNSTDLPYGKRYRDLVPGDEVVAVNFMSHTYLTAIVVAILDDGDVQLKFPNIYVDIMDLRGTPADVIFPFGWECMSLTELPDGESGERDATSDDRVMTEAQALDLGMTNTFEKPARIFSM